VRHRPDRRLLAMVDRQPLRFPEAKMLWWWKLP
jgi:hypothetical protein